MQNSTEGRKGNEGLKKRPPSHRPASAFTILELMVAGALLIMMLTLLVGVMNSVTSISSQASSRLDAVRVGREVFGLMQKDLTQAASTAPSRGIGSGMQFLVNPADTLVPAAEKNPTALFWQAPVARDRSAGDLAVVGYFVQRVGTTKSQLRRVFVEPSDTNNYQIYDASTNLFAGPVTNWINPTLLDKFSSSTNTPSATNPDPGWVADGVMGLWVRCLDGRGNVITTNGINNPVGWAFDSRQGFRSGAGTDAIVRTGINALPAYVDVGIVCVASRDVDRIDDVPAVPVGSPLTFDTDMKSYLANFSSNNPRVKTALALTRRIRISGGSTP